MPDLSERIPLEVVYRIVTDTDFDEEAAKGQSKLEIGQQESDDENGAQKKIATDNTSYRAARYTYSRAPSPPEAELMAIWDGDVTSMRIVFACRQTKQNKA
jgi:hypothetical protein